MFKLACGSGMQGTDPRCSQLQLLSLTCYHLSHIQTILPQVLLPNLYIHQSTRTDALLIVSCGLLQAVGLLPDHRAVNSPYGMVNLLTLK
uniref:Uncharacterized protein n=1 Tax=Arundo donax TaxID=35708 RepID=A0A0A9E6G6_ARUDO